ncbi:MAG: hypothetical protein ACAI25_03540 [Planctomycetota bacterium]
MAYDAGGARPVQQGGAAWRFAVAADVLVLPVYLGFGIALLVS